MTQRTILIGGYRYDKQYVCDYLTGIQWNRKPPAPALPADILKNTAERCRQARDCLIQE